MSKKAKKGEIMRLDMGQLQAHQMLKVHPASQSFLGLACLGQIAYTEFLMRASEVLPAVALERIGNERVEYEDAIVEAATVVMFGVGQGMDEKAAAGAGITLERMRELAGERVMEYLALADWLDRALSAMASLDSDLEPRDPLGDLAAMYPSPLASVALLVVAAINLDYPQLLLTWVETENIDVTWLPRFVRVCAATARLAAESLRVRA